MSCTTDTTVTAETDAVDALARMHRTGVTQLLVMDGDRLAGILTLQDLLKFLAMKVELEEK
jgi:CBS domain-containing protein